MEDLQQKLVAYNTEKAAITKVEQLLQLALNELAKEQAAHEETRKKLAAAEAKIAATSPAADANTKAE